MKKLMKNSEGFTIVELLVAVGVMGLVAMALMNLSYFFQKGARGVALRAEISYFDQKISNLLANSDNCEESLGIGTLIPATGKTDLTVIRTKVVTGVDQVIYEADTTFNDTKKLDNQISLNRGGVFPVWMESVFVSGFRETDYAETTTSSANVNEVTYDLFGADNKYGWAKVSVIFVVRQVNGKNSDDSPKYIYRRTRAEYPVAVIVDQSNQLVKCVDSSLRTATSAVETLCLDLGGSVTFVDGEPECAGSIDVGLHKGRRLLCANFGGEITSTINASDIELRNYDCIHVDKMQNLDCSESHLIISNTMDYSCAVPQGP